MKDSCPIALAEDLAIGGQVGPAAGAEMERLNHEDDDCFYHYSKMDGAWVRTSREGWGGK